MMKYIALSFLLIQSTFTVADTNYLESKEVQKYLDEITQEYQFDRPELNKLISGVQKQKRAIEALDKPAEIKPWYEYHDIFITQARINQGVTFWRKNETSINKASTHYGVSPEIILALLGVETFYGRITGRFPTLDTLVTLGFDYPRREKFFRKELTQFLLLCREEKLDCPKVKGSHGSAMGIGQFIPSSYRAYAVDFDKDGQRDLWGSTADVLGSVANYIAKHGWITKAPIAELTQLPSKPLDSLLNKKLKPFLSLKDLTTFDIATDQFSPKEEPFILLGMKQSSKHTDVWVGYHNFYVISRYNHSRKYAMAVYQLSKAIKREYKT